MTTKDSNHKLILTGETTDQSDSSHTLTFSGAHPTAKYGQGSFEFSSSGDYIQAAQSSDYAFGAGDFTIELWYNRNSGNTIYDCAMLTTGNLASNTSGWYIELSNRGIAFYDTNQNLSSADSGIFWIPSSAPTETSDQQWHHLAIVRNSGTAKIYVDGYEKASKTWTNSLTAGSNLRIGSVNSGTNYPFYGHMSDIRISKGVARYTAAFNNDLPTAPLETEDSRTKLLLNTNSALQDFEIGRMALAPTYAGDTKVVRRGYAFDGSNDYILVSGGTSAFAPGNGDFTIEFSFNVDSASNGGEILSSQGVYQNGYSGAC